jgi:hypothetical protein
VNQLIRYGRVIKPGLGLALMHASHSRQLLGAQPGGQSSQVSLLYLAFFSLLGYGVLQQGMRHDEMWILIVGSGTCWLVLTMC